MSPDKTMACKKLLIFGATGLIGKYITQAIVENKGKFDRIAIFTSQGTVQSKADQIDALKKQGVDVIVGDVTNSEDVVKAYQDIDTVISAVGRNVIEQQVELVRLANESPSVHRFFPSEYGTDIEYGPASANEIPHQKKLKVRAALREECDNLDHTYVVTGPYSDLFLGNNERFKQAGTFDVKNKEAVLVGDENTKISFTTMRDVGKLVVHAALHPEASRNKALRVNSFTATNKEILEAFEKNTGGQPWKVSYTSIEDVKKMEQEALEAGNPFATLFTLRRIWAEGGTLYEKRDNYLIDAEDDMDSLEDAVSEAVKAQTG
ncbi:hypothetical protein LTR99_004327 [Exophiala xenobiotica]|uniref:NmrA-like domain-containing protein n=1 Tax=Vermiconidia calcicola TaxID=1690605 RepID=A0AAV9QFA8_9PEZI|nr:hypothetical protein LTR96_001567 [Exophiala xenobiotica]KAK5537938.1 hypothetical protein LTR23_007398 [Chaetothyriales sp. CCFEE 6169]KAK5539608.1 hypothetical protein LTR25_003312 [Vermiconidia calcicola]KAK5303872.1 hypothetical protein LTR99_004327 [Exophiala xenobiotica]KAK5338483.1 hypothetical protein LTR98_004882 [Exophiala xenobiotica]